MRVFVAGGTGTLGRPLVRLLVSKGHHVFVMTRAEARRPLIEALGAEAVVADALDADAVGRAVVAARPTHVVHLLTALPPNGAPSRPADLEPTNRLRIDGTRHLVEAAVAAGATRIVAESFPMVYGVGDHGPEPMDEDRQWLPVRSGQAFGPTIEALRSLETQIVAADRDGRIEGVVLRYGGVYGPDAPSTRFLLDQLRRRRLPLPRLPDALFSFVHAADAAEATLAALEGGRHGAVYNVVDNEPLSFAGFVRTAAAAIGAPRPFTVPLWLVRLAAPVAAELMSVRLPLSNARARAELGWTPRVSTVGEGFAGLSGGGHP